MLFCDHDQCNGKFTDPYQPLTNTLACGAVCHRIFGYQYQAMPFRRENKDKKASLCPRWM